jgi:hypothetical protein
MEWGSLRLLLARGEGMGMSCPCLALPGGEREGRVKQGGGAAGEVLCEMCVVFSLSRGFRRILDKARQGTEE